MKKLKLDAESLEVESFATKEQPAARGTVHGQSDAYSGCWPAACWNTVNSTCGTYGTVCPPYCGGGDSGNYTCNCTQGDAQTECRDCEI